MFLFTLSELDSEKIPNLLTSSVRFHENKRMKFQVIFPVLSGEATSCCCSSQNQSAGPIPLGLFCIH